MKKLLSSLLLLCAGSANACDLITLDPTVVDAYMDEGTGMVVCVDNYVNEIGHDIATDIKEWGDRINEPSYWTTPADHVIGTFKTQQGNAIGLLLEGEAYHPALVNRIREFNRVDMADVVLYCRYHGSVVAC